MLNQDRTSTFSNKNISIINDNGKIVSEFMEIPKYSRDKNLVLYKPIEYYNNEILYTEAFSNLIFGITKDSAYVKYFFDFNEFNLDEEFLNSNKKLTASELFTKMNRENMVNSLDYFNENSKYLFFEVFKKGKLYNMVYNKTDSISYIFDQKSNPIWLRSVCRPYIYSDDQFSIKIFYPVSRNNIEEKEMNNMRENKIFSKLYNVLEQVDEMDNPYLIYYYFK